MVFAAVLLVTPWIISFAVVAYTFVFMLQAHTVPEHGSSDKGDQPPIEESMVKEATAEEVGYEAAFWTQVADDVQRAHIEESMAKEINVRNKFMCHREHLLKRTKADGAFICDVCEAPIAEGTSMMFCNKCDFSVCFTCHW